MAPWKNQVTPHEYMFEVIALIVDTQFVATQYSFKKLGIDIDEF